MFFRLGAIPGSTVIDYTWSYDKTRSVIEDMALKSGWKFAVVLRRGSVAK